MSGDDCKVFVLGIDALDWFLLQSCVEEGRLPTFKHLIDTGVSGELMSTIPPITGSAWNSMVTGKNPGKHGVFDFFRRRKGRYDMRPMTSTSRRSKAIWDILSENGRQVAILNIPGTYPPSKVNGIMVSGKLTPSEKHVFAYPENLCRELRNSGYRVHMREVYSKGNEEAFLKDVDGTAKTRAEVALNLMQEVNWDLFMVNFDCVDEVQHWYWNFMDCRRTDEDEPRVTRYADAVPNIYQKMDIILNRFRKNLDADTAMVIASDHGAGPQYGLIHLNNWLLGEGFLELKDDPISKSKAWMFKHGFTPQFAYDLMWRLGMQGLVGRRGSETRERSRRWLKRLFLSFSNVDWTKTKAYSYGMCGAIYLNLKGREPTGCVDSKDYERVRQEIIKRILDIGIPKGDGNLVERVIKREDVYWGSFLNAAPDFYVVPTETYSAFGDFEFFSNLHVSVAPQTGFHRFHGTFVLHGRHMLKGKTANASIIDVAPTVLRMMNVPVPSDIDGRVLEEAFEPSFRKNEPIQHATVNASQETPTGYELSREEEDAVRKRLRDLGYL